MGSSSQVFMKSGQGCPQTLESKPSGADAAHDGLFVASLHKQICKATLTRAASSDML